jgi:DNA modification methylase
MNKKLKIEYKKTCDCADNHISCVTAKDWLRGMVTIKEFFYESRDIRDKSIHPAMYPISLPTHFIRLLTHTGELVLDPFVGVGSTLIAAQDLGRNAIGFDLQKKYVDVCKQRLTQTRLNDNTKQIAIVDGADTISDYLPEESIALSITSPPYPEFLTHKRKNKSMRGNLRENVHYDTVQQYSNDPRDLGHMSHTQFKKQLSEIYTGIFPLMKPNSHCIININDLWKDNKRYATHIYVINALEKAGFEFRNTFIWDKRNLVNNVGIFGWPNNYISLGTTMEFILDFWKPKS